MSDDNRGWIGARLGSLSTGLKMLLVLAAGLLPLGIVAVLASLYSARENRSRDEVELSAVLNATAQRFNVAVSRVAVVIRVAAPALARAPGPDLCHRTIERAAPLQVAEVRYAILAPDGRTLCASPGFVLPPDALAARASRLEIDPDGRVLRFLLVDDRGRVEGAGEFSREALTRLVRPDEAAGTFDIDLVQGGRAMQLHRGGEAESFSQEYALGRRVFGGLELRLRATLNPITAAELLMILLPILMLLAAALIGWWIVERLLLRPLVRMQRDVSAYRPGGGGALDLPSLRSPAREISDLGRSFSDVTRTVARHEADLEAAVDRQTRLVREVHHRVKNNLQVVASLLNLHARGSKSEDVAAAYASIQRRVDALAVVHRNHYAELEENRGVALRSLISELAANLRATAPAAASQMQIRLDVEPFYGTQDVAVSIAFLVTEIAEFGMLCGATWVAITLEGAGPGCASLAIESDSLAGEIECDPLLFERFDRIITGLSRQLRSTLERVPEQGRYAVKIAVVDRAER